MDEKKGIAKIAKYFVNFQYGLSIVMVVFMVVYSQQLKRQR